MADETNDDVTVQVGRAPLMEVMSIVSAVAHSLRFTDPPQDARREEMVDYLDQLGKQAGLVQEDFKSITVPWFNEIVMVFSPGFEPPAPDKSHWYLEGPDGPPMI